MKIMHEAIIPEYKHGLVFGVFDGFHRGHQHFIQEAAQRCQYLTIVVTPDQIVHSLKQRMPRSSLDERIAVIQAENPAWRVVAGDTELGSWHILDQHTPDALFLGYDQHALGDAISERGIPIIWITAHQPDRYKSSLLSERDS